MIPQASGGGASRSWVTAQIGALFTGEIYEICTTFATMDILFFQSYKSYNVVIA